MLSGTFWIAGCIGYQHSCSRIKTLKIKHAFIGALKIGFMLTSIGSCFRSIIRVVGNVTTWREITSKLSNGTGLQAFRRGKNIRISSLSRVTVV